MATKKTAAKKEAAPKDEAPKEPETTEEEPAKPSREHVVGTVERSYHPAQSLRVRRHAAGLDPETGLPPEE